MRPTFVVDEGKDNQNIIRLNLVYSSTFSIDLFHFYPDHHGCTTLVTGYMVVTTFTNF